MWLRDAVAGLPGDDVLSAAGIGSVAADPTTIDYTHLYESEHVSIGIFHLPAGSQIPLHNHPGMTVVSRVLQGALRVSSYDWAAENEEFRQRQGNDDWGVAVRVFDGVVRRGQKGDTSVLFPVSGGNMHAFEAIEDCAVLDVICPPYDRAAGRSCTYYCVEEIADQEGVGLGTEVGDRDTEGEQPSARVLKRTTSSEEGSFARRTHAADPSDEHRVVLRVQDLEADVRIVTAADLSWRVLASRRVPRS